MEKFIDILNMRSKNYERRKEIERLIENMESSDSRLSALCEELQILTIENLIHGDNMRLAYVNEAMPIIIEEYSRYNGKRLGEKTKDKINSAIKARINCHTYIENSYSTAYFSLVPLNNEGYKDFRFSYDDFKLFNSYESAAVLDSENRINADALKDYKLLSCGNYVDDPHNTALEIIKSHGDVMEALENARKAVSAYNNILPSKIRNIYIDVKNERLPH